jgi:hypothetical protein
VKIIQVLRAEVHDQTTGTVIGRSPARTLLGGIEAPDIGLQARYLAAADLVLLQQSGQAFVPVPDGLRSRLRGANVTTPGGGLVGTAERFQDPLQPVIWPLVVIAPSVWPPPAGIPVWRRVLPQADIAPGLAVNLLLPSMEVVGEITQAPRQLPYGDASHSALAAQTRFPATVRDTAHGAPVVCRADTELLVGMIIGTQTAAGETLVNVYPLAAAAEGGIS